MDLLSFFKTISNVNQFIDRLISKDKVEFQEIDRSKLDEICSTPFKSLPNWIERKVQNEVATGLNIIIGGPGTGKTRQGLEFVNSICDKYKIDKVYYLSGYISQYYKLSLTGNIKKVVILIDDFDAQKINIGSLASNDNPLQSQNVISNLKEIFNNLNQGIELISLVATVNTQRISVSKNEINKIDSNINVCELEPVSIHEFCLFIDNIIAQFQINITDGNLTKLKQYCDGRFSTISTFLAPYVNSTIGEKELIEFETYRTDIWQLFKNRLTAQQLLIYNAINLFLDFNLKPRLQYLYEILKDQLPQISRKQLNRISNNLWRTNNSEVIVFKSQFTQIIRNEEDAKKVVEVVMRTGSSLSRTSRYEYQEEVKKLLSIKEVHNVPDSYINLVNKMRRWFPHDRFIALLKASHLKGQKKYLQAIFILYKTFHQKSVLAIYSGKWVEVRLHLLLAEIYYYIKPSRQDWKAYIKVENEYIFCERLANIGIDDHGAEDFEIIYGDQKKGKESFSNYISELGYKFPYDKYGEIQQLKEIVHLHYCRYLDKVKNRDFDKLFHLDVLISLNPTNADYYLYSASTCISIGDSTKALSYLDNAKKYKSVSIGEKLIKFSVDYEYYRAYADLGQETKAKMFLKNCIEYQQNGGESNITFDLNQYFNNEFYWKNFEYVNRLRKKEFVKFQLTYFLNKIDINLKFPFKWRIQKETSRELEGNIILTSIFLSPVLWKENIEIPYNSSILIYLGDGNILRRTFINPQIKNTPLKVEAYNIEQLFNQRQISNEVVYSKWNFNISALWPKKGYKLLFEFNEIALLIEFMTENVSEGEFYPIFDEMENDIINQIKEHVVTTLDVAR
jgi:hypothetical protein